MSDSLPTLWQLEVSHYSEKVRWALAHKDVKHKRVTPLPGGHMAAALWLTRGAHTTFPILSIEGRRIWDSTAIIATLEERYPDPALYPADSEQRRRALGLEDFFDEELGPHMRLLVFYELGNDPERFKAVVAQTVPAPLDRASGAAAGYARAYTALRFRARDTEKADLARTKIVAALDRLEAELEANGGEYLVGDGFTVADLTAASLFYPLVLPAEGPLRADQPPPEGLARFRAPLEERPGYAWIEEMFRRHRKPKTVAVPATP